MVTENTAGIVNGKPPVDFRLTLVAPIFPGNDFQRERPFIGQAAFEALAREDAHGQIKINATDVE